MGGAAQPQDVDLAQFYCILLHIGLCVSQKRPYRLAVRTRPSQGWNPGSIPGRVTNFLSLFFNVIWSTQMGRWNHYRARYNYFVNFIYLNLYFMKMEGGPKNDERKGSVPAVKQGSNPSSEKGVFRRVMDKVTRAVGDHTEEDLKELHAGFDRARKLAEPTIPLTPEEIATMWDTSTPEQERAVLEYVSRDPHTAQAVALFRELQNPNLTTNEFFSKMSLFNTGEGVYPNKPEDPNAPLREGKRQRVVKRISPTRLISLEYYENGHVDLGGEGI